MAKLNVVIPLDSVSIYGVEYRKVSRKARAGDVIRIINACSSCVTVGDFYGVEYVDSQGDAHIRDNDGDDFDTVNGTLEVYEKSVYVDGAVLIAPVEQRFDMT